MINNFDDIFLTDSVKAKLCEMLTKEKAFLQPDFPLLSDLYERILDPNEIKFLTKKSEQAHGNLGEIRRTKQIILTDNIYPQSIQFFNEKLLIGLRFTRLLCDIFGNEKVFSDHLEIAAGTSLASYSMRCMGIIENSDANDIVFRGKDCKNPQTLFEQLLTFLCNKHDIMQMVSAEAHKSISGENAPTSFSTSCLSDRLYKFLDYNGNYNHSPYDRYYSEDFLSTKFEKKYDLITMYAGINYFENEAFFEKVNKITKLGAVVLCINDYFYDAGGGGMRLPLHMPWLHTLFSKEDLISLYEKYFSKEASEYLSLSYYYPSTHINQKIQARNAKKWGFKEIFSHRTATDDMPFIGRHAFRIRPLYKFFSRYRPDLNVESADFGTYYNTQVFIKE